jgi:hypothetical protein
MFDIATKCKWTTVRLVLAGACAKSSQLLGKMTVALESREVGHASIVLPITPL